MWLTNPLRAVLFLGLLFVLVGCGDTNSSDNANYAQIPSANSGSGSIEGRASGTAATAATQPATLADTQVDLGGTNVTVTTDAALAIDLDTDVLEEATYAYDEYLGIRSDIIVGDADADALSEFATTNAIAQVMRLRTANDEHLTNEAIIAMTGLMEWSNISAASTAGGRITLSDCTERQYITRLGSRRIAFATNEVVLVSRGDAYAVESVTESQNGAFATVVGERGCVPSSFGERADTTVTAAITEIARLVADPASRGGVSDTLAPDLARSVASMVGELDVSGLYRISDETFELSVVGMDLGKPEFTVIVAMCTTYPTGYYFVTSAGQRSADQIAPGSSELAHVYVQLDPGVGAESADAVTAIEPQDAGC